jgi:hypothetical protein
MIPVEQWAVPDVAEDLAEVLAVVGLTRQEMVELVLSGVKVTDLLEYVDAVVSDRMN